MTTQHIGIIGAGTAGLRCAALLARHEHIEVTVLEARDRAGGRVVQDSSLGMEIDMGANWIHDAQQTPFGDENKITVLCSELGIATHRWNDETVIIDREGRVLPEQLADQAMSEMWEVWRGAARFSREHLEEKCLDSNVNLKGHLARTIKARVREANDDRLEEVTMDLVEALGAYTGEAIDSQSLRYCCWEVCDEDDEFVVDTFRRVTDKLLEDAQTAGASLNFNTEMISAEKQHYSDATKRILVRTRGGEMFQFDQVVLTTPLGWLKKNAPSCIPALNANLAASIKNAAFGRLEKILVRFPRAFWDDGRTQPVSFMQWLRPDYVPPGHQRWKMEALSLASVKPPKNAPVLMFYIFGDCSSYVCQQTSNKSDSQRQDFLREFMDPYIRCIPGYDDSTCAPCQFVNSQWCTDEFSLGSYTTFTAGNEDAGEDIATMRWGMPEVGIWLAGEHTAPLDGLGSVYGAYKSAEAVADRIVASM